MGRKRKVQPKSRARTFTDKAEPITKARLGKRWTQADLAKAAGLHPVAIAKIERGKDAAVPAAIAIADALDLAVGSIWPGGKMAIPNEAQKLIRDGMNPIRAMAETSGMTLTHAAKLAKVSLAGLHHIAAGKRIGRIETIAKIAGAFGIETGALARALAGR